VAAVLRIAAIGLLPAGPLRQLVVHHPQKEQRGDQNA
jgi:hypothetical protein